MAIVKKMTKRGFTLIELMIVVVIIGVLAALAIYGVQKYVANSKSAEARMMLGRMSKDHLAAFEGETQNYAILAPGASAAISRALCPGIPVAEASVDDVPGGEKTQPAAERFRSPADGVGESYGWACLGFSISTPTYYRYRMDSSQADSIAPAAMVPAVADDTFTAIAEGDLDNDGDFSLFELGGRVDADPTGGIVLVLATTVQETNPEE